MNNKIYIGQTWQENVEDRMNGNGYSGSIHLFSAIKYHGVENFKYTVLEICFDQELADYFEKYYIKIFNTQNRDIGYNIAEGGGAPMQGKHHTPEAKAKISVASTGRKPSPESIAKRIKTRTKPLPPITTQDAMIKDYLIGMKISDMRDKYDVFSKVIYRVLDFSKIPKRGQKGPNNFTGKQHTPETKAKMSKSAEKLWQDRKENKND
jgi:group I intron endonuclease